MPTPRLQPTLLLACLALALAPAIGAHGAGISEDTRHEDERVLSFMYLPDEAECHDPSIDIVHFEVWHDEHTLYAAETVKDVVTDPYCRPFGHHMDLQRVDVWWAVVLEDMPAHWGIHMITYPLPDGSLTRCVEMGPYTQYGIQACSPEVSSPVYSWTMPLVGTYTSPWGEEIPYDLRGRHFDNVAAYAYSKAVFDPSQPRLKLDYFDDSPKYEITI